MPLTWRTGRLYTVTGTAPGAGNEISVTVPAGVLWELVAVRVDLAQGATQTPQPLLQIDDGATVICESLGSSAAQAASTTCRYTWAPNLALTGQVGSGTSVRSTGALPPGLVLSAGAHIKTLTLGIGANTTYS